MAIAETGLENKFPEREFRRQTPLIVTLEDERAMEINIVGTRAANLARLRGYPDIEVPSAFVVTTGLGDEVFQINPKIKERVERLDKFSNEWIKAKLTEDENGAEIWEQLANDEGGDLRRDILDVDFLPGTVGQISSAYDKLSQRAEKSNGVCVKISWPLDDLEELHFPGFDNVRGKKEVMDAIVDCFFSQFGKDVTGWRNALRLTIAQQEMQKGTPMKDALTASKGLSHMESKMAIVVQEMGKVTAVAGWS